MISIEFPNWVIPALYALFAVKIGFGIACGIVDGRSDRKFRDREATRQERMDERIA